MENYAITEHWASFGTWEIKDCSKKDDQDSENKKAILFEKWPKEMVVFHLRRWPSKWIKASITFDEELWRWLLNLFLHIQTRAWDQ